MKNNNENCGHCKYHRYDQNSGEWVCTNPESDEFYGLETEYEYTCEEWEGRR